MLAACAGAEPAVLGIALSGSSASDAITNSGLVAQVLDIKPRLWLILRYIGP